MLLHRTHFGDRFCWNVDDAWAWHPTHVSRMPYNPWEGILASTSIIALNWESYAMPIDKKALEQLIASLKRQRDELAVKVHLGKAEAKQEWEKVEEKIRELTVQYKPILEAVEETGEGVLSAVELAAQEVKKGLDRVRKLL